mmetsp:Transcript_19798/g.25485  ORF Transcript_19798/g.25485 Transcript_19798/m.25485 type:complete len:104 (-) Transcript_19798:36-347(-)|eukprot:CAMPEP_0198147404 /NCGR_PEP_ID=MMETSP1443-20131203/35435_1 /TAXON_ID=186043 /ORGANISM="Entomoneis sp., Strain CCMP2396" /LENGTH=103 /DNA_ID=CAMNT_0043811723 /DNA_START=15 /DNA_END=326 /DNA_ORIENTATION=-
MSRGNQREIDRAKAQAKINDKKKQDGRSGNVMSRNNNDATALQAKLAAKQEKLKEEAVNAAGGGSNGGTASGPAIPRKKVQKKTESMDDLLSSGLSSTKKRVK